MVIGVCVWALSLCFALPSQMPSQEWQWVPHLLPGVRGSASCQSAELNLAARMTAKRLEGRRTPHMNTL